MSLNSILKEYLYEISKAVSGLKDSYVELYEEEAITNSRLNIRLRVRMGNEFLLEINEAVVSENDNIVHLGYRYHFQNGQNDIVFRYDNTPHFPNLNSFPNHKHLPAGVEASEKPSVWDVIKEASRKGQ